jgi:hypothetical protein
MFTDGYDRLAGGGLEEELKRRLKLPVETQGGKLFVQQWPWGGVHPHSLGCPTHNCQMVDFFFSCTDGCSRDALQGGHRRS